MDEATPDAVEALLAEREFRAVMYPGWTSIDELERAAGEKLGRPRVKLRTWDELLETAERVAAEKA
jgi:ferredoxin--NADP+ reductase